MIQKLYILQSDCLDPYQNLATERRLLETVAPDACILYLWQNQNTVVIGRNQNPWAECRIPALEADGGHLARRLSGGGAVFHDLGNLNFTFLMHTQDYDLARQQQVIRTACGLAGISAEVSGRNDLLAQGKKFSGNAFYHSQGHSYHHGTLLIDTDAGKLQRYLSPPKAKLEAKGVRSVRSRVINLKELQPDLTCQAMKQHMIAAFQAVYGLIPAQLQLDKNDLAAIGNYRGQMSDPAFLYGAPLPFSFACEGHFPWGHIRLELSAAAGRITQATVYTDAMDWNLAGEIQTAFTDCTFDASAMQQALLQNLEDPVIAMDLSKLLAQQM